MSDNTKEVTTKKYKRNALDLVYRLITSREVTAAGVLVIVIGILFYLLMQIIGVFRTELTDVSNKNDVMALAFSEMRNDIKRSLAVNQAKQSEYITISREILRELQKSNTLSIETKMMLERSTSDLLKGNEEVIERLKHATELMEEVKRNQSESERK